MWNVFGIDIPTDIDNSSLSKLSRESNKYRIYNYALLTLLPDISLTFLYHALHPFPLLMQIPVQYETLHYVITCSQQMECCSLTFGGKDHEIEGGGQNLYLYIVKIGNFSEILMSSLKVQNLMCLLSILLLSVLDTEFWLVGTIWVAGAFDHRHYWSRTIYLSTKLS